MKLTILRNYSFCFLLSFLGMCSEVRTQVLINEYSAANLTTIADDFDGYEDWIELHNSSEQPKNLSGYFLSDALREPKKWKIPAGTTIEGNGYLLIWCDNRDGVSYLGTERHLHSNFNLTQTRKNAQTIVLSDADGKIVDQTEIKKTRKDQSRGRLQDGALPWVIFTEPSPGRENYGDYFSSNAGRPEFSHAAGFYDKPIMLNISSKEPSMKIFYSTDGSEPDSNSTPYIEPILIEKNAIVKAVCFPSDKRIQSSLTEFATYFIGEKPKLKVVSISGENSIDALLAGEKNEKPFGTFEFFNEDGIRKAATFGEYNSHGQDSWINHQRSVDFISRDECGYNKAINEKLFNLSSRDEFQRVILRAAGDDNYPDGSLTKGGGAHLRDAFVQNLAKKGGLHLDVRTAERAIVYVNGKYWGIYEIRERPDDHDYTKYYYNQGKYDVEMLQTWGSTWAEYGDTLSIAKWDSLAKYITTHDMADSSHYRFVEKQLDIRSLCDYIILNSVTACSDWVNYNTGWWRGNSPEGSHQKWGYQLWDNDATFGYYLNYTGIKDTAATGANPCDVKLLTDSVRISFGAIIAWDTITIAKKTYYPGDTISRPFSYTDFADVNLHISIFTALMHNEEFNQYYITRYHDLLKTVFSKENMLRELDAAVSSIAPEMPAHIQRWGGNMQEWTQNVARLRNYISRRCDYLTAALKDCYQLTGPFEVTFDVEGAQAPVLEINSIPVSTFPYTDHFFGNIGIAAKAHSNDTTIQFKQWITANQLPSKLLAPESAVFYPEATAYIKALFGKKMVSTDSRAGAERSSGCSVYPTLFNNLLFVKMPSNDVESTIFRLLDPNGKQIKVLKGHCIENGIETAVFSIDLSDCHLFSGMYLLEVLSGSQRYLQKVIKL